MRGPNGSADGLALGQHGGTYINNTTSNSGNWGVIYCITDCTFTTLTSAVDNNSAALLAPGTGSTAISNIALTAGMALYGHFTTIQLATGSVVAYKN